MTRQQALDTVRALFPDTYRETLQRYRAEPQIKVRSWLQATFLIAAGVGYRGRKLDPPPVPTQEDMRLDQMWLDAVARDRS